MKFISTRTFQISIIRRLCTTTVTTATRTTSATTITTLDHQNSRSRTPLEKQLKTWRQNLKPGFTHSDVTEALRSRPDPESALDVFQWTAQQRHYKHNDITYLTMIESALYGKRFHIVETLIEEILAGGCPASLPLYNTMIKICGDRKFLFKLGFDVYRKMLKSEDAKPNLETYSMLFFALLQKFHSLKVSYVYLKSVKSLDKQMKESGVIPNEFILNMIIKAYSKCHEMDDAIMVFREMGLYGCKPDSYTYSYLISGFCEKRMVNQGMEFYREMKGKWLVPKGKYYMILICSLAMGRRFDDAIEVTYDLLNTTRSPDLLTYKTLFEEMCWVGKVEDAFKLLEEFRKKDSLMNEKTYNSLWNGLHRARRNI